MAESETLKLCEAALAKTLREPCDHKRYSHAEVDCVVADLEAAVASAKKDATIHAGLAEDLADAIKYIEATEAAIGQRARYGVALDILRRRLALAKP